MGKHIRHELFRVWLLFVCACIIITSPAYGFNLFSGKDEKVSQSGDSGGVKVKPGRKKVATIYKFRSSV